MTKALESELRARACAIARKLEEKFPASEAIPDDLPASPGASLPAVVARIRERRRRWYAAENTHRGGTPPTSEEAVEWLAGELFAETMLKAN